MDGGMKIDVVGWKVIHAESDLTVVACLIRRACWGDL